MRDDLAEYVGPIQDRRRGEALGPSSADSCYKQLAYKYLGVAPSNVRSTDAADIGTLLHLGWSAMIRSMYDPSEREADVRVVIPGMPRPGAADDVDWEHRIVTDLKGASDRNWQALVNRGDVYPSYWRQLTLYAYGLHIGHGGDWSMRVVLLNRDTGERAEFVREADLEEARALVAKLVGRHEQLSAAASFSALTVDPLAVVDNFPREGRGPGSGMPCDWCEFLDLCWPTPTVDGGTPQSETVRDDAEQIGRWAQEYLEAHAEESKASSRKSDAQAFLKGVDGVYPLPDGGSVKITTVGGEPSRVPDCDAMRARLEEAGEEVPMTWRRRSSYPRLSRRK